MRRRVRTAAACAIWLCGSLIAHAHSGPPFPIVSDRTAGAYVVSIWTDPDATDDGSAAGQFWVMMRPANTSMVLPAATRARVSIAPSDGRAVVTTHRTEPVNGEVTRQFAALVLDHEGRFFVNVSIDGPLGKADIDTEVDATYDLRPPRAMLIVYVMPFVLIGFLWGKQLLQRRRGRAQKAT
jgi:hypothetical protein